MANNDSVESVILVIDPFGQVLLLSVQIYGYEELHCRNTGTRYTRTPKPKWRMRELEGF
jgi:hypothetical protein